MTGAGSPRDAGALLRPPGFDSPDLSANLSNTMQAKTFLTTVLGTDGFEALNKAATRLPELEAVFVPRTVIAWLDTARRLCYEGAVPGVPGALLSKGHLLINNQAYQLTDTRASAALMIALMDDVSIPEELEPKMIARLAKSVETLTKQRFLAMLKALEDAAEVSPGEATGSPETTESAESMDTRETMDDLGKGIEDMSKGQGWKASDGMTIPKGSGPDRQAWDEKYKQAVADRYAGGDVSKLVPVQVPVSEHAATHHVPLPTSPASKLQPRYRVPMYQKMLAAGDQLPPVFVEQSRPGVFRIIDGNARLTAALLHGKTTHLQGFELKKGIEEPGKAAKPRAAVAPSPPQIATKAPGTGSGQAKPAQPVGVPKGPGIPEAPSAPQAPTQKTQTPQVSRARGFYKSELLKACPKCNETQMRGRQIVGCLCITDVVMGAELTQKSEGERIVLSGPDVVILAIEERLGLPPG